MKLLTAVCNSLGTLTLASFLVAFLERVAFYLPHFCFPINNWAYGTADGLCPIPGTVTSKCDHGFLHFCMNLLTCFTCEKPNIYPSSDQESMVEIFRVNIVTNMYCKRLDRIYIHISFLTFPWQRCFFSGTQYIYFRYSTFFFILCSFTKLPAFLHVLVPFSQPGLSLCLIMYSNLTTPISE